jgi:hypothetical protein
MKIDTTTRAIRSRSGKGQAMTEFLMMGAVAMIILFVAIQMAALGREAWLEQPAMHRCGESH